MAEMLEISARNYQRLENGEVEPKLETLSKISKILEIPIASFFECGSLINTSLLDFSTSAEIVEYINCSQSGLLSHLHFAKKLIEQDKLVQIQSDSELQVEMHGTEATLNDSFMKFAKVNSKKIDVDKYSTKGSIVDRWELAFRLKLKSALFENYYMLPSGFKAFQIYHYNLTPNPDNPRSECYLRDITDRHNLETWMKSILTNKLSLNV